MSPSVVVIVPLDIVIPVPPVKWALTSLALGPVYVSVPPLYAKLPSPPASLTVSAA